MFSVTVNSCIKGYHKYHVRPHPALPMKVNEDRGNVYDQNALKVIFPELPAIPSYLLNEVTREADNKHARQTFSSDADKMVGHVPANVCGIFKQLIQDGLVTEICCSINGVLAASINPPTKEK